MSEPFDPYQAWLGIPESASPPTHYQLLGLPEFESDPEKITAAADARMRAIRSYQTGPRGRWTHKLLNQLAAAKLCLLDPRGKETYDRTLVQARATRPPIAQAIPIPFAPPLPEPPAASPPLPNQPQVAIAPTAESPEDEPHQGSKLGWIALGLFFVLVILGTGQAFYFRSTPAKKPKAKPPAAVPPVSQSVPPAADVLVISQEGSGDLNFPPSGAELSAGLILQSREGETLISGWPGEAAAARWRFKIVRPAIFQVRIVYAATAAGAQWQMTIGEETKARDVQSSADGQAYITDEFFWRVTRGGEQTLELGVRDLPADATISLKSLRFVYQGSERK